MNKFQKKVVMFIVEGPTDENALSPIFKNIYEKDNDEVKFHVVHGDITSNVETKSIIKKINEHVKLEMEKYRLRKSDILEVIHLIDTDGAFIAPSKVIEKETNKIIYTRENIESSMPKKIIERNRRKRHNVRKLMCLEKINGMKYSIYYLSRNLEDALHGRGEHLTNDEKIDLADEFAEKYENNINEFKEFMSSSDFTVDKDYEESWKFIMEDENSLKRYSNLHLVFA